MDATQVTKFKANLTTKSGELKAISTANRLLEATNQIYISMVDHANDVMTIRALDSLTTDEIVLGMAFLGNNITADQQIEFDILLSEVV